MTNGPVPDGHHKTVVITWPDYPVDDAALGGLIQSAGAFVRLAPKLGRRTAVEVAELVADADAAIVSTDPFDETVFARCGCLRVVARVGVGVDSIDLEAASRAGVAVTTTPGANDSTAADHTLALMLAALRRIPEHDRAVRGGEWRRTGPDMPWDLAGATVGLIGYGRIGKLVARRLEGFDTQILVCDPVAAITGLARPAALSALLRKADVISVHTPLLPSTRGLIGADEFAQMKQSAVFVNTSRGGVVDERAMIQALKVGALRAAALDVFEHEPPSPEDLLELPNVVLTPHIAGISDRSVRVMLLEATSSVLAVLAGEPPIGLLNPEALQGRKPPTAAPATPPSEASR
jgi:phosphoglycerate dehydrogenase-like enzyme